VIINDRVATLHCEILVRSCGISWHFNQDRGEWSIRTSVVPTDDFVAGLVCLLLYRSHILVESYIPYKVHIECNDVFRVLMISISVLLTEPVKEFW